MPTAQKRYVDMICRARCVAQGGRPVKVEADQRGKPKDRDLVCPHCGGELVLRP